jgi:SAM-dependent methyltransferase
MSLMMNIKWENVSCFLCGNRKHFTPLKINGKQLVAGQFGYTVFPVICKCGLVMLNPRWSKKDYDIFYRNYYDELYRLDLKPDYGIEGVIKNTKIIWDRIEHLFEKNNPEILDAGAGSGAGFIYLREKIKNANFSAIESSDESIKSLTKYGAEVIANDLESDWSDNFENRFDLIILRHVIEHFLDPVETLKKISKSLAPDGIIYIATPDMMKPRVNLRDYDLWWEYWFRAVHPYYFSNDTLGATFAKSGLKQVIMRNENEEIWCAVKKCPPYDYSLKGNKSRQMKVLKKYLNN